MAAAKSQQRKDLETLRLGLLAAFRDADVAVKAQIAGQLRAVVADLAKLGEPVEVSKADELATQRAARRANAAGGPQASRRSQPRRRGSGNRAS